MRREARQIQRAQVFALLIEDTAQAKPLTWPEIAQRCNVPERTLRRWWAQWREDPETAATISAAFEESSRHRFEEWKQEDEERRALANRRWEETCERLRRESRQRWADWRSGKRALPLGCFWYYGKSKGYGRGGIRSVFPMEWEEDRLVDKIGFEAALPQLIAQRIEQLSVSPVRGCYYSWSKPHPRHEERDLAFLPLPRTVTVCKSLARTQREVVLLTESLRAKMAGSAL